MKNLLFGVLAAFFSGSLLASSISASPVISFVDPNFNIQTITTGGSYTLPNTVGETNLHAVGTLATFTIVMPAAPTDGQVSCFVSDQGVTATTTSPNSGQSILGTKPGLNTNLRVCYRYQVSTTTWYPY